MAASMIAARFSSARFCGARFLDDAATVLDAFIASGSPPLGDGIRCSIQRRTGAVSRQAASVSYSWKLGGVIRPAARASRDQRVRTFVPGLADKAISNLLITP